MVLGSIFRSLRSLKAGSEAASALPIIADVIGEYPPERVVNSLKIMADSFSESGYNRYEYAALQMYEDFLDPERNHQLTLDQSIKKRVVEFFEDCKSEGLVKSYYVLSCYEKLHLGAEAHEVEEPSISEEPNLEGRDDLTDEQRRNLRNMDLLREMLASQMKANKK